MYCRAPENIFQIIVNLHALRKLIEAAAPSLPHKLFRRKAAEAHREHDGTDDQGDAD